MAQKDYRFGQFRDETVGRRGGWQVYGRSNVPGRYRTRKGKFVVSAYNNDLAQRSDEVLELMAELHEAHKEKTGEFKKLKKRAKKIFTKKSYKALRVYS